MEPWKNTESVKCIQPLKNAAYRRDPRTLRSTDTATEKGKQANVDIQSSSGLKDMGKNNKEFLQIMKQSEYSIVDQSNKTPTKISILSLILSFEPYCHAL